MTHDVVSLVGPEGWCTWQALTSQVDRKTVATWTASGKLMRLGPAVYATAGRAGEWRVRVDAAVRTRRGVASHSTALALWGLVPPPPGPVHVTVTPGRSGRGTPAVTLHRSRDSTEATRRIHGLAVTCVERVLVDTWGSPGKVGRPAIRAAAITAVRERMCPVANLQWELSRRPQLPARASFAELVQLLADGCRSELEIWGCLNVLRGADMPTFVLQRPITARGETFFLDAACEESKLAVEMDGASWHGSRSQRERDIRRDALVATLGWQILRFSYARMVAAPEACRADIRSTHAARLRMMQQR